MALAFNNAAMIQVFGITELLENILLHLNTSTEEGLKTLLFSQRTNKTFEATIKGSIRLQRKLFLSKLSKPDHADRPPKYNRLLRPFSSVRARHGLYITYYSTCDMSGGRHIKFIFSGDLNAAAQGSWRHMYLDQGPGRYHSVQFAMTRGDWRNLTWSYPKLCDMGNARLGDLLDVVDVERLALASAFDQRTAVQDHC